MTNHTIKAVLLDYGGVIADEGFQNSLRAISREQGLDERETLQVAKRAVYDSGFILGSGTRHSGNRCVKVPVCRAVTTS